MNSILNNLIQNAQIWQAGQFKARQVKAIPSGWNTLDPLLPGHGWPQGSLTELLCDTPGIGELQLLLPAMKAVVDKGRYLFWIDPPFIPYAPALSQHGIDLSKLVIIRPDTPREGLWALEQILRNQHCGIAMAWPKKLAANDIRRLQLAAEKTDSIAFLFREERCANQHSPAALRLKLKPAHNALGVSILKRRGGWAVKQQLINIHQPCHEQNVITGPWLSKA